MAWAAYGIDPATKTAWAVVNRGGEFVVTQSTDGDLNGDNVIDSRDLALVSQNLNAPASTLPAATWMVTARSPPSTPAS